MLSHQARLLGSGRKFLVFVLAYSVIGCRPPPPPPPVQGIRVHAQVILGTSNPMPVIGVLAQGNVTTDLGPGSGTLFAFAQSTDQAGNADVPNAKTNAIWSITTNWLTSAFSACVGTTTSIGVPANALATLVNTCTLI